jgi:phosphatidylethanolamine/phosphatidyl-N-methylethanolamine N-methyltransferase
VIQHKLLKAKTFINQSVTKALEGGTLGTTINLTKKQSLTDKHTHKYQQPPWLLFARETWRNPRTMGTVWASSSQLARTIANLVPPPTERGLIIELGAGTGVITEALLQKGIAPEHLISLERSASLADYLHKRYPYVRVIKGDALHLSDLLGSESQRINTIVSGLPFRCLPRLVGHRIIKQIETVLPKNGLFIQFTYNLFGRGFFLPHHFKPVYYKIVFSNFPPARIDVYKLER